MLGSGECEAIELVDKGRLEGCCVRDGDVAVRCVVNMSVVNSTVPELAAIGDIVDRCPFPEVEPARLVVEGSG